MSVAVGLGVALASSPTPRILVDLPSYGESLLGFPYPPPPTVARGLGFQLDPLFFTASLIAGVLYVVGVVRLVRRGDHWPVMRTVSWLAGLARRHLVHQLRCLRLRAGVRSACTCCST